MLLELREAAQLVAIEARRLFAPIDARSAATIVGRAKSATTAVVEQKRRKVTGQHPEFGALQVRRAMLPARAAKQEEVERRMEDMLDRLGRKQGF